MRPVCFPLLHPILFYLATGLILAGSSGSPAFAQAGGSIRLSSLADQVISVAGRFREIDLDGLILDGPNRVDWSASHLVSQQASGRSLWQLTLENNRLQVAYPAVRGYTGSAQVALVARDPGGYWGEASILVWFRVVNRPPRFLRAIEAQRIKPEQRFMALDLATLVEDPDDDVYTLHWSATGLPAGWRFAVVDMGGGVNRVRLGQIHHNGRGGGSIRFRVRDGAGGEAVAEGRFQINQPPQLEPFAGQVVNPGEGFRAVVLAASDGDGNPLTWRVGGLATGWSGTVRVEGGQPTLYVRSDNQPGLSTLWVEVDDGLDQSRRQGSFRVNAPPRIRDPGNRTVTAGERVVLDMNQLVSDPDSPGAVNWRLEGIGWHRRDDAGDGRIELDYGGRVGRYPYRIIAIDGEGGRAERSALLTVKPRGQIAAHYSDREIGKNRAVVEVDLDAGLAQPRPEQVNWSLAVRGAAGFSSEVVAGQGRIRVPPHYTGTVTVKVEGEDPRQQFAPLQTSFGLTVVNHPPVFHQSIPDQKIGSGDGAFPLVNLATRVGDPDPDETFQFRLENLGDWQVVWVEEKEGQAVQIIPTTAEDRRLRFVVSDGSGAEAISEAHFQVNRPPRVTVQVEAIQERHYRLAAQAEDRDGDPLRLRFHYGDGEVSDWQTESTAEHRYSRKGVYSITVEADDGWDVGSAQVSLEVANIAPSVRLEVSPVQGPVGDQFQARALAEDPDSEDQLRYRFRQQGEEWSPWGIIPTWQGVYRHGLAQVVVEVSDGETVVSARASVQGENRPPQVLAFSEQEIEEGQTFQAIPLDLYVHDPDDRVEQMAWSYEVEEGPFEVTIDAARRALIRVVAGQNAGEGIIRFVARDPWGGVGEGRMRCRVLPVEETFYLRDALGRVIAIYDKKGQVKAFNYYGNDQLGRWVATANGGIRQYYLKDHLGSTRVVVDENRQVVAVYGYEPFGKVQTEVQRSEQTVQERFTGKPLDQEGEINLYYFGARYYDSSIGRFLTVDPHADNYPTLSPYSYCANNPLVLVDPDGKDWYNLGDEEPVDIQWREGSDPQLKPGLWNWFKSLVGKGKYTESLGEEVVVGIGSTSEKINEAKFELYSESKKDGPIAEAKGNTLPSDQKQFATISEGLYSAELTTYKGKPALLINKGGKVSTVGPNPNPESKYYGQNFADEIFFHAGNNYREDLWTLPNAVGIRTPISKGCQTGFHGNRVAYLNFMKKFSTGWKGNYYLIRK